jgi:hypothetical protein
MNAEAKMSLDGVSKDLKLTYKFRYPLEDGNTAQ